MSGDGGKPLTVTQTGQVAVLALGGGRDAILDIAARAALIGALDAAEADPGVAAIVLAADGGRDFAKSGDLRAALDPEETPTLSDLTARVAHCRKPVVACLAGRISGSGAALALAAHYRVAASGARIGWADVALGRMPGGGATQRLPRLVGGRAALDLLLAGRAFPLAKPMLAAMVDDTADDGAALDTAVAYAARPGLTPRPVDDRRDGLTDGAQFMADIAERRDKTGWDEDDAAAQTVAAVEAAVLLPISAGLAFESEAAARCAASPRAQALHRMSLAERNNRAVMGEGGRNGAPLTLAGGGPVATGLALAALDAGQPVRLAGPASDQVARQIGASYSQALKRKRLTAAQRDERLARLKLGVDIATLEPGAPVLLTDTAAALLDWPGGLTLAVTSPEIAEDLAQPVAAEISVALPAHARQLVELRPVGASLGPALPGALTRAGRMPVQSRGEGPLALTRLWAALDAAADRMVIAGVPPERVDGALRGEGWAALPFLARDGAGLGEGAMDPAIVALFPDAQLGVLDAALSEAGRTGQAGGAGYYDYSSGRAEPDPTVTAILSDLAEPSDPGWSDADIARHLMLALSNEGVRLIDDGTVARAAEVDLIAVHGLGVPRLSGGPLGMAETLGLAETERRLRGLASAFGPIWAPHPGWDKRVRNGLREVDAAIG